MSVKILHRAEVVALAIAVYIVTVLNISFWQHLLAAVAPSGLHDWGFLAAVAIALIAVATAVLILLALPYLFKTVAATMLIVCAGATYFMLEYGTLIDENMIRNVLETDPGETHDLITLKLIVFVGLLGVVPAILLWRWPIAYPPLVRGALMRTGMAVVSLAVAATAVMTFYQDVTSIGREHRELKMSLTPSNIIAGLERNLRKPLPKGAPDAYGQDARKSTAWATRTRRVVTVLVIGETARAANFSLNGYARKTNPQLQQVDDLINFTNATSCGTDTALSVPCIFSGYGRAEFRRDRADRRENLLDILKRAGFDVLWRDNQAGCKGVCERVPNDRASDGKPPGLCAGRECFDEALLSGLGEKIDALQGDAVIVLHMMGSHGPAYYKRSTAEFQTFKPACNTNHLSRCSHEELVNAFDNSILYTDHVLAKLITLLAERQQVDSAMIYASDHGESLGEKGIYLHGMPYAIAPVEQTHIPMMLWLSPSLRDDFGVDQGCLTGRRDAAVSHDNIFHTVLGLLEVNTSVYQAKMDLFAPCRRPAVSVDQNPKAG